MEKYKSTINKHMLYLFYMYNHNIYCRCNVPDELKNTPSYWFQSISDTCIYCGSWNFKVIIKGDKIL